MLGDFTLVETARSFAAARITVCHATVGQTIQELIELKMRNVESVPCITDLKNRLAAFAAFHPGPIQLLRPQPEFLYGIAASLQFYLVHPAGNYKCQHSQPVVSL